MFKEGKNMKRLIIIPAFNEAENLPKVISSINSLLPDFDYVVINDGSRDDTKELCEKEDFNVVNLPINSGIGVAVQTGYKYALYNGYDIAIQIDGDGQHDVNYLKEIVAPLEKNEADVVIGSRFIECQGFQSSGARRVGIRLLSFFHHGVPSRKAHMRRHVVRDNQSILHMVDCRIYPLPYS